MGKKSNKDAQTQGALNLGQTSEPSGPVECLGMTFENDETRREHFIKLLAEKLKDTEFRKTPGFPEGSDDDILQLSDPPYYTACPNPFLSDFVRHHAARDSGHNNYRREPFAIDVSEGKTDQLFQLHSYHTKVPYLAIVPSILHYTKPGDVVLDGFCGSGMTGVAVQWCDVAPDLYRRQVEQEWKASGLTKPEWGRRHAILGDIGPAATFIAANYNSPFEIQQFANSATQIFDDLDAELGWMYSTKHTDGRDARINYTVWSEVFSCPECSGEVVFLREALDPKTKKTKASFPCPRCSAELAKSNLERLFETRIDPAASSPSRLIRFTPVLINYSLGKQTYEKSPDEHDLSVIDRIAQMELPREVPLDPFPLENMYHGSRLGPKGFTHIHHMFLPRAAQAVAAMWRRAKDEPNPRMRNMLLFLFEQGIWTMTVLNRYQPGGYKQVNKFLTGVYYVPSAHCEVSPWYALAARAQRIARAFRKIPNERVASTAITTGDCGSLLLGDATVDYVFTDPPFGANIFYADLNILVESWHHVITSPANEAIVDRHKKKNVNEYQELMRRCFREYHRVLKPGRWMTVVFSNSSNAIWRAIQEAMGTAGFVVADVRTLDKKQGSYRQVTSSAVKQDLVISAYKPTEGLAQKFQLASATPESAWAFVDEHLRNVPVFVGRAGEAEVVVERTAQMLLDRMIAFHVQRGVAVPISGPDFTTGLMRRYPEREGMFFLSNQVDEWDRERTTVGELKQLSLFVIDEATAIQWVRQQLRLKPQSFQELQPQFMRELHSWAKHEQTVELREILEQNCFKYEGAEPVPSQIHSYLSSNFKHLRNREKTDPELIGKAKDRWYVPDPNRQADLEKMRDRTLLREFNEYSISKQRRLKEFRTEAVRVGFKAAYDTGDYATIISVASRIPEKVLQEDSKLLMYFDVATMRLSKDTD